MATISLSDAAPKVDGDFGFALANVNFDLGAGGSYDTDDPAVLSAAEVHPFLKVEFPEPTEEEKAEYDPNDPHQNPVADHLSVYASPEVKQAADEADAAIQEAAFPENPDAAAADKASESEPEKPTAVAPIPVVPAAAPKAQQATPDASISTSGASS